LLCNFFLTYFENDIFHKIPAAVVAAAADKNSSCSSGYGIYQYDSFYNSIKKNVSSKKKIRKRRNENVEK
jgi:hypothetical protein